MAWLALIIIFSGNLCLGYSLLRLLHLQLDPFAQAITSLALGTAVIGWVSLILVEIGVFSLPLISVFVLVSIALTFLVERGKGKRESESASLIRTPYSILPFFLLPLSFILFLRPHQQLLGGADAGVYTNLAVHIAETGGLLIKNPTVAALDRELLPYLGRTNAAWEHAQFSYLPGFFLDENQQIIPQFYAFHPVWQAVVASFGGAQAALLINGIWATLGICALFLVGRDVAGKRAGWLAMVGLLVCVIQIWFARYPTTEVLTQFLLWMGVWAIGRSVGQEARSEERGEYALIAGLMFGCAMLTRIDTFFLIALPMPVGILLRVACKGSREWYRPFFIFNFSFLILAFHAFAHAWFFSRPYFLNTFATMLVWLSLDWWFLALLIVCGLLAIVLAGWLVPRLAEMERVSIVLRGSVIIAIVGLALVAWFYLPTLETRSFFDQYGGREQPILDHLNFVRLGWYLSPLGVWLGVLGVCLLVWRVRAGTAVLLGIGLFMSVVYLWRNQANPHQIYVMRRYLPMTIPLLTLGAAVVVDAVLRWRTWVGYGVAVAWIMGLLWLDRGFVTQVDYAGLAPQIADVEQMVSDNSILIFNDANSVGLGDLLGTPLAFQYGHDVFTLRNVEALPSQRFEQQIERWVSDGRNIYWITVEGGVDWPLDVELEMIDDANSAISWMIGYQHLETSYDYKPTRIINGRFAGEIWRVNP